MESQEEKQIERNRKKGVMWSIIVHTLLVLLFFLPLFSYEYPPPEQEGVLVSFGEPNIGRGDDAPSTQDTEPVESSTPPPEEAVEPIEDIVPEEEVEKNQEKQVEKQEKKLTTEDPMAKIIQEQKKKKAAEEAQRKALEEAARKKAAAEEAQKQKEFQDAKKQYGNIFGKGKGETDVAGNQGDPSGDPDASVLQGISTGSGVVGGGLGSRGVTNVPTITDRSQKAGRVVVNVCVDESGKVISASYTQRGSTTTDKELRAIAVKNARLFHFTESNVEKQCGTITVNFQLE